jgi:hypothetical protein
MYRIEHLLMFLGLAAALEIRSNVGLLHSGDSFQSQPSGSANYSSGGDSAAVNAFLKIQIMNTEHEGIGPSFQFFFYSQF